MKVVVIPKRPIPGILPKNKWISEKTVLDLNKNEIKHCMQFGNVYDEHGNLIDAMSIKTLSFNTQVVVEPKVVEPVVETVEVTPVVPEPVVAAEEPIVETVEEVIEPVLVEEPTVLEDIYFNLEAVAKKENEFIILEAEMKTNSVLEGNLYGLFSVISGTKPVPFEYMVDGEWIKFNNKFANFEKLEDGDKLAFRLTPKNESEFGFRILIKEANNELVKLEGKVNPAEL